MKLANQFAVAIPYQFAKQAMSIYANKHTSIDKPRQCTLDKASALVDRWRPETHKFHLPVGEMTSTLQDVSMLLGLPFVGARCTLAVWRSDGGNTSFTVSRVFYHQQVHMFA